MQIRQVIISLCTCKTTAKVLIISASLFIIIFRRPDVLSYPQFFAEDGFLWFSNSYHQNFIQPFFTPVAGYLQTISRIAGLLSQFVPLSMAPLVFNGLAILVHLSPIVFLLSNRLKSITFPTRFITILAYLLMANTSETYLNITNSQWYLSILAFLVLFSDETSSRIAKIVDVGFVTLSGFSGPFSIILSPICFINVLLRKKLRLVDFSVFVTAVIQITFLLYSGGVGRGTSHLGFSLLGLFHIYTKQVFFGLIGGPRGYDWIVATLPQHSAIIFTLSALSLVTLLLALLRGTTFFRSLLAFGTLVFLISVFFPMIQTENVFLTLENTSNVRYWLIPMFSLAFSFTISSQSGKGLLKVLSSLFLCVMLLFFAKNYRHFHNYQYTPYVDYKYKEQSEAFMKLQTGQTMVFKINPSGWSMSLTKK